MKGSEFMNTPFEASSELGPLDSSSASKANKMSDEEILKEHHRDIQGGGARAAVFGISDGLVSNISLVLGVIGAHPTPGFVRLAGLAGMIGGACSMAAGEYISMKAQKELFEKEIEKERHEIKTSPEAEKRELILIFQKRGIELPLATELANETMKTPEQALETHVREELGLDPDSLGSPTQAAAASFVSFAIGAILPVVPWFFVGGMIAVIASIVLGAVSALAVGGALAYFTGRPLIMSSLRQLFVAAIAAGITFSVGAAIGASGIAG